MQQPPFTDPSQYQTMQLPHSPVGASPSVSALDPQQQIQTALAQLSDIAIPPPTQFWPPAPGWWIAAIITLVLLYLLVKLLQKLLLGRRNKRRYIKTLLNELKLLKTQWLKQQNIIESIAGLSVLIRRFALLNGQRVSMASIPMDTCLLKLEKRYQLKNFQSDYQHLFYEIPYQDPAIVFDSKEKQAYHAALDRLFKELEKLFRKGVRHV